MLRPLKVLVATTQPLNEISEKVIPQNCGSGVWPYLGTVVRSSAVMISEIWTFKGSDSDLGGSFFIWPDLIWHNLRSARTWSDLTWPDLRSDPIWSDLIWPKLIWSYWTWSDLMSGAKCYIFLKSSQQLWFKWEGSEVFQGGWPCQVWKEASFLFLLRSQVLYIFEILSANVTQWEGYEIL